VLVPPTLPDVCPTLRSLSCIHALSLDPCTWSEPDSVSALDEANTWTDSDPHNGRDRTAHPAGVPERENGAGTGCQGRLRRKAYVPYLFAVADQRSCDLATELHGYVPAVGDRDEHHPCAACPPDAKTAQREVADDPPGDAHLHTDAEPQPHRDAAAALRACRH
jgi:hypothetical protein